jgi:uncharacterized protein (DUF924 family)
MRSADDIYRFWFEEHGEDDWFAGKAEFDARIAAAFTETHAAVARGEAWGWRLSPRGRIAEIIVLDQFSRQLFRGQAKAFAQDPMALALAQELVAQGLDKALSDQERVFAYLPYMHSESLLVHNEALRLYTELGNANALDFEVKHREAILRFGRFPRRNQALGRQPRAEEIAYLEEIGDRVF